MPDSGRGVERCGLPQYDGDRHRTVRPEDQGLFDICGFRRSGHEASVFEVVQFRSGESLVHRIDQRIARDEDHQGRGTEIEGFVADVLPDPYRAVFRHTETTVDYAQVDIDQLPGVVHRVGVDRGVCFGQDGGDGFGVGIVSADQLCKGVPVCRDDLPAGRDIQFAISSPMPEVAPRMTIRFVGIIDEFLRLNTVRAEKKTVYLQFSGTCSYAFTNIV